MFNKFQESSWSLLVLVHRYFLESSVASYENFESSLFTNLIIVLQPHVDFGLKLAGADLMSIPGLYRFVQVIYVIVFLSYVLPLLYSDL